MNKGELEFKDIELDKIITDEYYDPEIVNHELFKVLLEDIKVKGISLPILVTEHPNDKYLLVTGRARYTAAKLLGHNKIDVYVTHFFDEEVISHRLLDLSNVLILTDTGKKYMINLLKRYKLSELSKICGTFNIGSLLSGD